MAGSYPDVPGYRFAYDADGTILATHALVGGDGLIRTLSASQKQTLNRELKGASVNIQSMNGNNPGDGYLAFLFPEPRIITGYFIATDRYIPPTHGRLLQYSTDTNDGRDGTWQTLANPYIHVNGDASPTIPDYRSSINSITTPALTGIRFAIAGWVYILNLYGTIPPTESPNRLRIVDLTDADIAAQLDFGVLKQRSSSTRQFKVINNSTSQTANSITVSLNAPSDANPSLVGQYQISTDNISFANAVNIGTLAPGAESGILYVRMNPANNAQLGPWAARIIAHPTSWS